MARRSTKGWKKKSKYLYENRHESIEARVVQNPSYMEGRSDKKWIAQIVYISFEGDYAMKRRKFKNKTDGLDYIRDYIDRHEHPKVTCNQCGSENLRWGKSSSTGYRKVFYQCDECGYDGPGRHTVEQDL